MQKIFETPEPVTLYVELGSGDVKVQADEVTQTTVNVEGNNADEVSVEQHGNKISVVAPSRRSGLFGSSSELTVTVVLPTGSGLTTKLGSADLVGNGRFGETKVKSGSGDVRIDELGDAAVIETGSGDIATNNALGDLRIKSGSGDVGVERAAASTVVSTGSGDVFLGVTEAATVVKSGSGDIRVKEAQTDLNVSTASGDLSVGSIRRGSVQAKGVSGDVRVGVPAGIPVWTDISCVSGRVSSTLEGAGQPGEGQDFIEVRAKTVSGDIVLEQV